MSKIEDLIEKLCPNGVPFIKLQEMAEIGTGRSDRKNAVENGEYPFYVRSKEVLKINKYEFDETAIIIPGEGGIGEIFHYVEGKYALHQRAYRIHVIDNKLRTKYLYYYMFEYFKNFIMTKAVTATVTSIRKPMIEQFPIAVPPLEVQDEIVHILDDFTLLSAELSAELKARQQQYEYYLNNIFNKLNDFETKNLEQCCIILDNKRKPVTKALRTSGEYPYYGANGILDYVSEYIFDGIFILVGEDGTVINKNNTPVVTWAEGKIWVNNHAHIIKELEDKSIDLRYLYYYLQTLNVRELIHGNIPKLNQGDFRKLQIKVPKKTKQIEIANILDRFDKLCNDISEGLPAEIEARQKQYEYYRDKLLTFKELEVNEVQ